MQKCLPIIPVMMFLSLASAYGAPKKKEATKKSALPVRFLPQTKEPQSKDKVDPFLGFRPETDPTKKNMKSGPTKGKDVVGERDDLITKQRQDINRMNSPSGSDALQIPSYR